MDDEVRSLLIKELQRVQDIRRIKFSELQDLDRRKQKAENGYVDAMKRETQIQVALRKLKR